MKRRLFPFLAAFVLVGFLAGGAIAPTLHRVHHAQEQHQAQQAAPQCAHGALTGTPVVEEGGELVTVKRCPVLARHVMSVAPPANWQQAALRQEATRSAVVLALHAASVEGHNVIRGPPGRL